MRKFKYLLLLFIIILFSWLGYLYLNEYRRIKITRGLYVDSIGIVSSVFYDFSRFNKISTITKDTSADDYPVYFLKEIANDSNSIRFENRHKPIEKIKYDSLKQILLAYENYYDSRSLFRNPFVYEYNFIRSAGIITLRCKGAEWPITYSINYSKNNSDPELNYVNDSCYLMPHKLERGELRY